MATRKSMTVQEHVQTALQFLEHSDREFAADDVLQGSEKLWGAASHAITAVAKQRGWPFSKYQARVRAVDRLAEETGDDFLPGGLIAARQFHSNFYHDWMEDVDIEHDRPLVHDFVRRLLNLVNGSYS